jgi:hypothetical protein
MIGMGRIPPNEGFCQQKRKEKLPWETPQVHKLIITSWQVPQKSKNGTTIYDSEIPAHPGLCGTIPNGW